MTLNQLIKGKIFGIVLLLSSYMLVAQTGSMVSPEKVRLEKSYRQVVTQYENRPEAAIKALKALLPELKPFHGLELDCYNSMIYFYVDANRLDSAVQLGAQLLDKALAYKDYDKVCHAYNTLSHTHSSVGELEISRSMLVAGME